jgi:hypothetical protein
MPCRRWTHPVTRIEVVDCGTAVTFAGAVGGVVSTGGGAVAATAPGWRRIRSEGGGELPPPRLHKRTGPGTATPMSHSQTSGACRFSGWLLPGQCDVSVRRAPSDVQKGAWVRTRSGNAVIGTGCRTTPRCCATRANRHHQCGDVPRKIVHRVQYGHAPGAHGIAVAAGAYPSACMPAARAAAAPAGESSITRQSAGAAPSRDAASR